MALDIKNFLDSQQHLIVAEKKRLGLLQDSQVQVKTKDMLFERFVVPLMYLFCKLK